MTALERGSDVAGGTTIMSDPQPVDVRPADAATADPTSSEAPGRVSRRRLITAAAILAVTVLAAVVLLPPLIAGAALLVLALLVIFRRFVFAWSTAIVLLVAVIMFVPARRYAIPIPLPFQLEPYRLVLVIVLVALVVALLTKPDFRWRPVAFGVPDRDPPRHGGGLLRRERHGPRERGARRDRDRRHHPAPAHALGVLRVPAAAAQRTRRDAPHHARSPGRA